ncbi:Cyclase, putative [Pyrococcus sp. NA2]|uniref:cyclase family protein n=1 Tax=Pyrococcus sp. (strain NA2) TaxID=342949 RepID=UPI000209AA35|nr:cyclase family protein [Pyrococcus sp. NA2]AEC52567.1 Cyclase, putative [Pyrococcus sp. NA2]
MIIDLSISLGEETPVYPGDPRIEVKTLATVEKDGYYMNILKIGEHSGTHVDAPAHFIPGGKTIDVMPLEKFIGSGLVLDVRDGKGEVKPSEIPGLDYREKIVLFLTEGRELSPELARFLVEKGVKAVGTDSMSIGNSEVHRILLSAEVPIFENLTNLEVLLGKEFTFIGFPLKIRRGSGSPVRAIAILRE